MNLNIDSGYPRAVLLGVDDQSTAQAVYEPPRDAQHTPLFLLRTERGPTELTILNSSQFTNIYGERSVEVNSTYHTHQTEALKTCIATGNASIAVKRIVGDTAHRASYQLYLEATPTQSLKYTIKDHTTAEVQSTSILQVMASSVGFWGNEYAIAISPADAKTQMLLASRYQGFVYELRIYHVDPYSKRKTPIYNNYGDTVCLFSLNPDTREMTQNPYFLSTVLADNYQKTEDRLQTLFTEVSVNQDVLNDFHAYLKSQNLTDKTRYWDYDILGTGGLLMAPELAQNFKGGHDGYTTSIDNVVSARVADLEIYDDGVRMYFSQMDDTHPIGDMARYPISAVYDTGFSMLTKLSFRNLLAIRSDVYVGLSTFMVADHYLDIDETQAFGYNTAVSQDDAIAQATRLRTAFYLQPESELFGTATMRALLTIQSGIRLSSGYNQRQSIIIDIVEKISRYMGAGDGSWKSQFAFDQAPLNELSGWSNVNYTYRSRELKETCWDAGITWVENKGTHKLFYPAFQTVYPDDTSTLNNIFTMMACCYLNKVFHRAWAHVSGNSRDPDEVLIEDINGIIENEVIGKFDNRFIIVPESKFTPTDHERGYSWTTELSLYSNVTRTTGIYKLTTQRLT